MTREEAERLSATHNAEHPERGAYRWTVQPAGDGAWRVVRVRIPGGVPPDLKETTEARPKPPMADDPRPAAFRNVPPYGPGV